MSNAIDFLEKLGQDADLRYASAPEFAAVVEATIQNPALRSAFVAQDGNVLETLLGAQANVCCMIQVAAEDEAPAGDEE